MVKRKTAIFLRKSHRYLGVFIGIQFVMWTVSGLYFSWTDLDEIHGDHFKNPTVEKTFFSDLKSPQELAPNTKISALELKNIAGVPFYLVNDTILMDARSGLLKTEITKSEALAISEEHMLSELQVAGIDKITETGKHHEYRGSPLPAYVISYKTPENLKSYVSVKDGSFRTVRHRDWRWFDFLWMTHTMDYEGRDNFNNLVLRIFSLMGLITVLSGFVLWYISSPSIFRIRKYFKRK